MNTTELKPGDMVVINIKSSFAAKSLKGLRLARIVRWREQNGGADGCWIVKLHHFPQDEIWLDPDDIVEVAEKCKACGGLGYTEEMREYDGYQQNETYTCYDCEGMGYLGVATPE